MESSQEQVSRYRKLGRVWWTVLLVFSAIAILLAVLQIFALRPFGFMLVDTAYFYYLMAFYISLVFIVFPATKSPSARDRIPWYDYILFLWCLGTTLYFASMAPRIIERGWEYTAPPLPTLLSIGLWLMILEAVRRSSGMVLTLVCLFFSFYPVFATYMPGFLEGINFSLLTTARYHIMSSVSVLGLPMQVVGSLLIGFMLFGVALQASGGGKFFLDFSLALMGNRRGGPAKVSVISSSLFGTMSGSVISNVLVDGPFTIPAMKKTGYPAHYAAAIEAVSSTGGALMPPVMGATAFVMASFLGIPYSRIIVYAAVPALLYYAGLFFQVDAYAARSGLKGLPKNQLPSLKLVLKQGWFYIFALLALIIMVFVVKHESQAPFYTMIVLFLCAAFRKETRITARSFLDFIVDCGRLMAEIVAILAAVGLVIGSLSMTGVAHSFSRELVGLAGGNIYLLLIVGALTSFILGMGMTATACYIFLAITLAPALVSLGLNPIAVHLFVLYWGLVSFITPPVALGAITAAPIAGADPVKTGFAAMRLGSVIYFIPFFFVLNPAIILIGPLPDIIISVITAFIGVYLISGTLEGYLVGIGHTNIPVRVLIGISGISLMAPYRATEAVGAVIIIVLLIYGYWKKSREKKVGIPL